MGGVGRHDCLRSSFSLCKAHKFHKYYFKLFLFLLDVGLLTNAWIYYKLSNPERANKYGSQAAFFQSIVEAMVNQNTNWSGKLHFKNQLDNIDDNYANCAVIQFPTEICMPLPLNTLPMPLSTKI
jgi:hypothetical protein